LPAATKPCHAYKKLIPRQTKSIKQAQHIIIETHQDNNSLSSKMGNANQGPSRGRSPEQKQRRVSEISDPPPTLAAADMQVKMQLRAVFVEYQPTKDTSSRLRPFHHGRVVVTEVGQHLNREPLNAQSSGFVYDRHDGVVIGTTTKDKVLAQKDPQKYEGLANGWQSVYYGFTDHSFEEIEKIANELVQDQVDSKIGYNIVFNHCHTFAEDLALRIGHATSVKSITKFPINSASSHRPFAASQITRVFDYTDPGIEYKSIADAMREGLTDQPTELDEESVMISSVMGIQMPLEKPTNDSVERSATQGRESVSSSPGTYYGDSDTYGRSFRDELQPDWKSSDMDQDLKAYTHQPLASHDSIRILYLQPGSGDSLIRCTLKEVLLGEAKGKYEAVSYVWGRSDITSTIICNGAALPVTTNLELGLRTFRLEDRSRYLWADALEYQRLPENGILLLNSSRSLGSNVSGLYKKQHLQEHAICAGAFTKSISTKRYSWLAYSIHAPSLRKGARVGKLISDVFIDIMHTFDNRPTWRDMILFDKILEDLHPAKKQLYVDLLFCARSLRVTDQRDVIYSSLGSPLAHSVNGEVMVAPDYTEPWKQQQIRAAKALLRNPREGPHVLSMIVHDSMAELLDDGIPSWVPRWNTFDQKSTCPVPLISTYEYRQKPFRASLGSPLFNTTFPSPDTLSITGWKYDTVAWVSSRLEFVDLEEDLEEWKPYLREKNTLPIESVWLQLLEKTSIPPEELIGQFSLTLARGRPASDDHVDDLLLYCERLRTKAGTETTSPFPPKVSTSEVLSIAERSLPRSRDRRLAMTTQGRMALVPLIAEANDVCCIVQGMDVPMVFRKATNGTYKCLGETYCSGVMEGELLGPECTNEPEWTELHIR
ncbi:unnamed protein product, partial [Fusarium fujikuroi]